MKKRNSERGIAIVLALFLMSAMSVLAVSLMFLSQTETYATMNYRMMSQARYAAEAGVQKASNFLLDSSQYHIPSTIAELSQFDRTVSPVTYNGDPVILSASDAATSNYPVSTMVDAYEAAGEGTLTAGTQTLNYSTYAILLHMQQFDSYGGGQAVVQTWQIIGDGSLSANQGATVQVVATVETPKVAANSYAAFATANVCDAIYFHGNVTVNSYDSRVGPPTGAGNSTLDSGGDVGTNGNLHIQGSVDVQGNLYTPRPGVGECTSGAVTGLTEGGSADVSGSMVQLPTEVLYPTPTFSTVPPTTTVTINAALLASPATACSSLGLTLGTNCTVNAITKTVTVDGNGTDVTMPSVVVSTGFKLVVAGNNPAQTVNINSLSGAGDVEFSSNVSGPLNESVVLKVSGKNPDSTDMTVPMDLSNLNSWKQNSPSNSYDASALQIVYGGTATLRMKGGNTQSAATIYAPNARFELYGTQDLYGSILAKTIENMGNASIHYDRRLQSDFWVAGHPMMGTFTWNRY
ncbi:MAG TPA: pilus assembly PilX N-terminal domain-containing protein [Vicinamibacterales bacterium]|jgi:Tfp pilus assembly protein PilX|nr:pilus assembly PilX N-terminal domain-containing protein [Vicinamibacterales bacterium]